MAKSIPKPTSGTEPQHFLRYWREKAGLSQAALAAKASTVQQHITKLERGERDLVPAMARRLAKVIGVSLPQLYFGPKLPSPEELDMLRRWRAMSDTDRAMLTGMIERLAPPLPNEPELPESLAAIAREEGVEVGEFAPELWQALDTYAARELASIPEVGATTPERRAGIVASLYLLALPDQQAGRMPDYSRFRLFLRSQAASLRASGRRHAN